MLQLHWVCKMSRIIKPASQILRGGGRWWRLNKPRPWSPWRGACWLLPSPASGYKWLTSIGVAYCRPSHSAASSSSHTAMEQEPLGWVSRSQREAPWTQLTLALAHFSTSPTLPSFSSVNMTPLAKEVTPRWLCDLGRGGDGLAKRQGVVYQQNVPSPHPCPPRPSPPHQATPLSHSPFASRNYRP